MEMKVCTAKAPVNIAVIKYWGKSDEELIIPLNDSISVTLSTEEMCATTTVACSPTFQCNRIWLNGKEENADNPRLLNCLTEIKSMAMRNGNASYLNWPIHICSENNFPTAAGLASSAAGYACLVYALGCLYDVKDDLSVVARLGSGSACRSIYGGFVQWEKGILINGVDSRAKQIASFDHWPELRVLILVANANKKKKSSSSGMKETVQTSDLIHYRSSVVVPKRIEEIKSAILEKNFKKFAEITMKDSNQFHAMCLDTYPPIYYMDSTSYAVIDFVHAYNNHHEEVKLAYTFDAGPNACLFLLEKNLAEVVALVRKLFPSSSGDPQYMKGVQVPEVELPQELLQSLDLQIKPDALRYIISTKVGCGPETILDPNQHLLDQQGFPKKSS